METKLAKKPGPKKGTPQRRKAATPSTAASRSTRAKPARQTRTGTKATASKSPAAISGQAAQQSAGSRFTAFMTSPTMINVAAAALVSAAGALLMKKRSNNDDVSKSRDDVSRDMLAPQVSTTTRSARAPKVAPKARVGRPRKVSDVDAGARDDALVAAGVAGRSTKQPRKARGGRTKSASTNAAVADIAPQTSDAGPGAYPDGSPTAQAPDRISIEGGTAGNQ